MASSSAASAAQTLDVRGRLLGRLAASKAASALMVTSRIKRLSASALSAGVTVKVLYAAPADRPLRAGEPLRARLVELQPGTSWPGPDATDHREYLVLKGAVRLGQQWLQVRDYHVLPAGLPGDTLSSDDGALLFLRESCSHEVDDATAVTVRDAETDWPDFVPGFKRRVLWQHNGQAAMMYQAAPGASVTMHRHGHDEECLMVQGELFLDDVLLQEGDYQLAPAGTGHRLTATDTGVVIYAHGDLDLDFVS